MQSATLAYNANDLSSRVIYDRQKDSFFITHRRMNFADLNHCDTDYLYTASLTSQLTSDLGINRCAPDIVLPTGLYRAFPGWSTCTDTDPDEFEIWDPPRVLHSVTALDAPDDRVTMASRHTALSQTPSSAITGPGLEVPVPETKRSTTTYDGTRSTVPADSRLQSSSADDENGDGQKKSNALDGSSLTGSRTTQVSQTQVSFNSAESLPSVTAIFYTTHHLNTKPSSSYHASQSKQDTIAVSSSTHPDPTSNNADHSRSTVTSDPHNHSLPLQSSSSPTPYSYPTTHSNDPLFTSKSSLTASSFKASLANTESSLSSQDPSSGESAAMGTVTSSVAPLSKKEPAGMAALIMAAFAEGPTSSSFRQQQHSESTTPSAAAVVTANLLNTSIHTSSFPSDSSSSSTPRNSSDNSSADSGQLSLSSTVSGFSGGAFSQRREGLGTSLVGFFAAAWLLFLGW